MKEEYRQAFAEVYEIFKLMPQELLDKIPENFYQMIEEERDTLYNPNIKEPIENQTLKNETVIILGLIYRDFLCSPEERKELKEKDAKDIQKVKELMQNESRKKYNPDDIFENKQKKNETKENSMVTQEKWYQKIFNIIKNIFS